LKALEKCGVQGHTKKFEVDHLSFYLKVNEHWEFIDPSFKVDSINDDSVNGFLSGKYTLKEQEPLFDAFCTPSSLSEGHNIKSEAPSRGSSLQPIKTIELVSTLALQDSFELDLPKFTIEETGIFSSAPQLSFDVDPENVSDPFQSLENTQSSEIISVLKDFLAQFVSLKTKWSQTFFGSGYQPFHCSEGPQSHLRSIICTQEQSCVLV
jgi:hypothetical protein